MSSVAVGVGYVFNIFSEGRVNHIELKETKQKVVVDGVKYRLYKAASFEESKKVDVLLDLFGEKDISEHYD